MSRPFLSGTVADICFDLVSTRSEYGEERELADLVEARIAELERELANLVGSETTGEYDDVPY